MKIVITIVGDVAKIEIDDGRSRVLSHLEQEFRNMADTVENEMQRLQGDVTDLTSVNESAIALISGLAEQIRNNANDPAALSALADQLESTKTSLADAVKANTPADAGTGSDTSGAGGADGTTGSGSDGTSGADGGAGAATGTGEQTGE